MSHALQITLNSRKGEYVLHDGGYASLEVALSALDQIVKEVNDAKEEGTAITTPSGKVAFKKADFSSISVYEEPEF